MPNLLVYPLRAIRKRFNNHYLKLKEKPGVFIMSPGGTGSVEFLKYIHKYKKSNIYFEKKYNCSIGHNFRPPPEFIKKKVKIILIYRNFNEIYKSMTSRGFVRIALNEFGDFFPFMYKSIFKNKIKLKQKYYNYLEQFYLNWKNYDENYILRLNYPDLYKNRKTQKKIKEFLGIKSSSFLKNFPKFRRYKKTKGFIDPSTILAKKIFKKT